MWPDKESNKSAMNPSLQPANDYKGKKYYKLILEKISICNSRSEKPSFANKGLQQANNILHNENV